MTIDKIGTGNNIQPTSHVRKTERTQQAVRADRLDISVEARERAELERIVKAAPDIRADKVEQAKANLERYMRDDKIFDNVAKTIIKGLLD
ncbi:MAG: flagellar biosynthesis anti-sigma factor FlgM [Spirochaetes bacterium]|nr:flagellar biosynthesis anti-sigma factor FlgM [Spirochaetota bacterium]